MRYTFPVRLKLDGSDAPRYVGEARSLLGELMQALGEAGIAAGSRRRVTDAATIKVSYDGTMAFISISTKGPTTTSVKTVKGTLWIPRGIVLYPASDVSPYGWGLPVVQITEDNATKYSNVNLDPGLDVERWTEGGTLGQVLLTKAIDAGYPGEDDTIVPLNFSRTFGPQVDPAEPIDFVLGEDFAAFRLRLTGFKSAQSPTQVDAERAAIVQFKRGIFDRVNAHRVDIAIDPLEMPLFGFYDSAQITSEICFSTHTLGHFSERFPITFRTPEDRVTKDGLRDTNATYSNPNSRNFNTCENATVSAFAPPVVIGTDPNGVDILDIIGGGPDLNPQGAFDAWMASPHHRAAIEDTAWNRRGMSGTATFVGNRHNYGHQQFVRQEAWIECGNRVFECPDGLSPITWYGPASLNLAWETWPTLISPGSDYANPLVLLLPNFSYYNDCGSWLAHYMTDRTTDFHFCWTRAVFSGGRCIAYAPGLVWAAGVHKLSEGRYRLMVLTHNEADQPADKLVNGMTAKLRYYYCDLDSVGGAILSPESMVRGIYGSENEGYAWDVPNFAFSWRGGTLVDISSSTGDETDLLKYRSQWIFNKAGTKAACLRDYGPYRGAVQHRGYQSYTYLNGTVASFSDGLYPATVQLDFTHTPTNLTHDLSFLPQNSDTALEQIAVDFNDDDSLVYAYRYPTDVFSGPLAGMSEGPLSFTSACFYYVLGTGPYGVLDHHDLDHRYELPGTDVWERVHVIDVRRGVFMGERPVEDPCFVQSADAVLFVDQIVDGTVVLSTPVPNPTNMWLRLEACYTAFGEGGSTFFWTSAMATTSVVQGYYAHSGNDYVFGFMAIPQPSTLFTNVVWPNPDHHCSPAAEGNSCAPLLADYYSNTRIIDPTDLTTLAYGITSSFADTAHLQELVAANGTDFYSFYARVV